MPTYYAVKLCLYHLELSVKISVAAKYKETKQFYTLYNTQDDTKLYLNKEVMIQ